MLLPSNYKKAIGLVLLVFPLFFACTQNQTADKYPYTNALVNESSPYLLQHAHNPVNWYPWGDEALNKAQKEDKLIIISVGYSACHWCHVMEHESFSDTIIAGKMNDHFVSIKVDREERPDVDQIYMDAAQLLTGRGGWPLNVIALPNGKPVFAGTYFPAENWTQVLNFFSDLYKTDPQKMRDQADQLTEGIKSVEIPTFNDQSYQFSEEAFEDLFTRTTKDIDPRLGGRTGAPKFPMPTLFEYILSYDYFSPNARAEQSVKATLDNMANGGIYDHLGGGFSRYSTDDSWTVPHFEKMLYDNAQLVSLYSHAFQKYGTQDYRRVVTETLEFVGRELSDNSGGFYSSLDADSEGKEGKFYVWEEEEIDDLLGIESPLFKSYYGISKRGNFEEKNILTIDKPIEEVAEKFKLSTEEVLSKLKASKAVLMAERDTRIRPGLDDKILTSWNALMITGLVDAYFAFGNPDYLKRAIKGGDFILNNQLQKQGGLLRNYKDGKSSISGFLDDYSLTILAFIKLYEATFEEKWLYKAQELKEYALQHFSDSETQMFFYTSDTDDPLIARKMELADNVIPGSNSTMAHALFLLGQYFYNEADLSRAAQMLANVETDLKGQPYFYSNWARLAQLMGNRHFEVAVVGEDADAQKLALSIRYIPNKILLGGKREGSLELLEGKLAKGRTMIYVCENKACQLPVTDANRALKQMGISAE